MPTTPPVPPSHPRPARQGRRVVAALALALALVDPALAASPSPRPAALKPAAAKVAPRPAAPKPAPTKPPAARAAHAHGPDEPCPCEAKPAPREPVVRKAARRHARRPRPVVRQAAATTPDRPCDPPRPLPATGCMPLRCPLTAEERAIGKTAWAYFEKNTQETTGLTNATDGYPSATIWDQASALLATFSAWRLGIIDERTFDARMTKALGTLATMPLYGGELPNKAYDTRTATMVDYGNKPSPQGIGWSALDLARMVAALQIIRGCDYARRAAIDDVLLAWRYDRLFNAKGEMMGAVRVGSREQLVQEGRVGYQEYGAAAFRRMGKRDLVDPPVAFRDVYGVQVPYDPRDPARFGAHTYVVSESYILGAIELGWPARQADWAKRVFEVQRRRHERTGVLTAVSEDHLDRPPHFVYNTVLTDGFPWRAITDTGEDASALKSLSTKAAFGWYALYDTPYANALWAAVRQGYEPGRGFFAGRYEVGLGYNRSLNVNTNGIVLECLLFMKTGRPLLAPGAVAGKWERYRANVADLRALPGGKRLAPPPARKAGQVDLEALRAATRAWAWHEGAAAPNGLVPDRWGGEVFSMATAGDALLATAAARRLGLIAPAQAEERLGRMIDALAAMPLADGQAPATLYTLDGRFGGYDGQPREWPLGWNAMDLGRTLAGLAAAVQAAPALEPRVRAWLRRWRWGAIVRDGRLWGAAVDAKGVHPFEQGRAGMEQYAALGFAAWGHVAEASREGRVDRRFQDVGPVEVPVDRRPGGLTTTGPWLMAKLEHPAPGRLGAELGHLYAAQRARAAELGRPVALDAGPLDRWPFVGTDAIAGDGRTWEAFGPDAKPVPGVRAFSAGAAFGLAAIYADPYADRLRKAAATLTADPAGYWRGRYDGGDPIEVADAHTNALVLEAAAYQKGGPMLAGWQARPKEATTAPPQGTPQVAGAPVVVAAPVEGPTVPVRPAATPTPAPAASQDPGWSLGGARDAIGPIGWNLSVNIPLAGETPQPAENQTTRANVQVPPNQLVAAGTLQVTPREFLFARFTALRYLDASRQKPWHPDFTYAFGWDDWRPGGRSLTFEHYGGNRWAGNGASPLQGTLALGQRLPSFQPWPEDLGRLAGSFGVALTPRWQDETGAERGFKQAFRTRVDYRVGDVFSAWIAPIAWMPGHQQPWDPDFTYGFGLFDGRPNAIVAQYANYAGNRWWWRGPGAGFLDGTVSLSLSGRI